MSEAEHLAPTTHSHPTTGEDWYYAGARSYDEKRPDQAARCFRRALTVNPTHSESLLGFALTSSDREGTNRRIHFNRALATRLDFPEGHTALAQHLMPGPDYYALLAQLHEYLRPRLYLEIGVRQGASLSLAQPSTMAIGIDPEPCLDRVFVAQPTIYPITSDAYFHSPERHEFHRQRPIDLAFIDGLHRFEQGLRDFINVERYASSTAMVAIHDCIPLDTVTSSRNQRTKFYSGDVWKVVDCLRHYRPDLKILIVKCPPTGLAIIGNLDPNSRVLEDGYAAIVEAGLRMTIHSRWLDLQPLDNEWPQVERSLRTFSSLDGVQLFRAMVKETPHD